MFKMTEAEMAEEKQRVFENAYKSDKHQNGFTSKHQLAVWWIAQMNSQNGSCAYCKTPIALIRDLIKAGFLKGRNVRGGGVRGKYFELERIDPTAGYNPENCVLICYYCNNDKSNVYTREDYVEFLAPAKNRHFLALAERHFKKTG